MEDNEPPATDPESPPSPEEREAVRRMGQFLVGMALRPPLNWDDLADQALCEVTLLDYGPPEHVSTPTLQPLTALHSAGPLPLRTFARSSALRHLSEELKRHMPAGRSWGFSLRLIQLPPRIEEFVTMASGLLQGPFEPPSGGELEEQLMASVNVLWMGLQIEVLTDDVLTRTSGGGSSQWSHAYLKALIDVDVARGTVAPGTVMAQDDAELRGRYRQLARRRREKGDLHMAAQFSLAAVNTLPLATEVSSGAKFTRDFRLHQMMPELASHQAFDGASQVLGELLDEFEDLIPEWRKLEVRRIAEVGRLGRRASEGLAVWREINGYRLFEQGEIRSLNREEQAVTTATERRRFYMCTASGNVYKVGLEQAEAVESHLGGWLLASAHIASAILFAPLEMIADRVPVYVLESIEKTSLWAPNARLERLSTLEAQQDGPSAVLTAVHQSLDTGLPGIIEFARKSLAAAEEDT